MKRIQIKSCKVKYKVGGFEAGLVRNSRHPRNNVYLLLTGLKNKHEKFDFTIDEAAAIIHVLGAAIMDFTHNKRDILTPNEKSAA